MTSKDKDGKKPHQEVEYTKEADLLGFIGFVICIIACFTNSVFLLFIALMFLEVASNGKVDKS